ncbi:MAG TPA: hypothetical protein VGA52_04310 [Anaerolineales bacterium]|jgi:hypothetical protein
MSDELIEIWRRLLAGERVAWVLFRHGTVVKLPHESAEPAQKALDLMRSWGRVHVGTPAGDFNVFEASGAAGWIVTCHHEDILTYVGPDEVGGAGAEDLVVGLTGRAKRDRDAQDLDIVHIGASAGGLGSAREPAGR